MIPAEIVIDLLDAATVLCIARIDGKASPCLRQSSLAQAVEEVARILGMFE